MNRVCSGSNLARSPAHNDIRKKSTPTNEIGVTKVHMPRMKDANKPPTIIPVRKFSEKGGELRLALKLAHPFNPEEWPEVVKTAAGIITDNNLVPACTLIIGLSQAREDDITRTIELIDDLKDFKSLIAPPILCSLGRLKKETGFTREQMNSLHEELLIRCLKHCIYWAKVIMRSCFKGNWYSRFCLLSISFSYGW